MNISSLQKARYEYSPKLPGMLRNGISDICVCEGAETQSVADQEKIKALFPNTYGKKEITFQKGANTSETKKQIVGVILSGGQAPGGHNVICGLYDALKATNKENELYGFKGGPSGLLEDDYVRLGHLATFNGYDVLPMEQVANPYSATPYALKLDDTKIYVVSPASDKIVKIGVFGGTFSHQDNAYDNANKTIENTTEKSWEVAVVTNSVAGVVKTLH